MPQPRGTSNKRTFANFPDTRGFLKSGPSLPKTCIHSNRKAGLGRRCAEEGTPKFPGCPGSPVSGHPALLVLPGLHSKTLRGQLGVTSGASAAGRNAILAPSSRGPRGNSRERRFSAGRRGGNGWRRERICPSSSPGGERRVWECGEVGTPRWCSLIPACAEDSVRPSSTLNGARDPRLAYSPTPQTRRPPSPR